MTKEAKESLEAKIKHNIKDLQSLIQDSNFYDYLSYVTNDMSETMSSFLTSMKAVDWNTKKQIEVHMDKLSKQKKEKKSWLDMAILLKLA